MASEPSLRANSYSGAATTPTASRMRELPHEHLLDLALESACNPNSKSDFRDAIGETRARIADARLDQGFALEFLLTRVMALTRSTGTALLLVQDKDLLCVANSGPTVPELGATSDKNSGMCGECLREGKVLHIADSDVDPRADREACSFLGVRAVLLAPFPRGYEPAGVVQVYSSAPDMFNDRDIALLPYVARTLAAIVATKEPAEEDAADSASAAGLSHEYTAFLGELLGPNAKDFPNANLTVEEIERAQPAPQSDTSERLAQAMGDSSVFASEPFEQPSYAPLRLEPPPPQRAPDVSQPMRSAALEPVTMFPSTESAYDGQDDYTPVDLEPVDQEPVEPEPIAIPDPATIAVERPSFLTNMLEFAVPAVITVMFIAAGVYWNNHRTVPLNPIVIRIPAPPPEIVDLAKAKDKVEEAVPKPDVSLEQQNGDTTIRAGGGGRAPGVVFEIESSKSAAEKGNRRIASGASFKSSSASANDRVRLPAEVMQARLVRLVAPLNPAGSQGVVVLHSLIDKTGQVKSLELTSGNPLLAPWAITAVTQWRYVPYIQNGRATEVETDIHVNFQ